MRKALNDPSHLERIDWRKTETIAIDHKQQVNQFFNRSLREILQRCYNNGINEYNTISDKLTKNNINQSVFQKILAIENRVAEDKNFVLKNWGSCDLEKRKMRKGAFDLLNRLDQNIIASRYLQQNSYIEYIYPEQENFSFEQNRDIDKEEQLKKLPEGILTKLAKATETSKGSLKNISSTSNTKITEHKQIVLNTQEILLNNVDYPERSKKSIRTAREKNSVRSNISSMSEALENLRRSLHEVKNTHLTEALKEIDTLCASSGETMRADKEPIFGTNDAHSVHM